MPKLHFLLKFSADGFTTSRSKSFDARNSMLRNTIVTYTDQGYSWCGGFRIFGVFGASRRPAMVSSALRAGQPRCLRRFAPASQSFDASRRPSALRSDILILCDVAPNWLVLKKLHREIYAGKHHFENFGLVEDFCSFIPQNN